jgi:Leucine-rich repeat (LRR) protein
LHVQNDEIHEKSNRINSVVSAGFSSKQRYSTAAAGVYSKSSEKPAGLSQSAFTKKKSSIKDSGSVYRNAEESGRNMADSSYSTVKKKYQMDKKSTQTELIISNKDIKFVTVNMLNMNLRSVNLSGNKIQSLPNEICDLVHLEDLSIFKNHVNKLP